MLLDQIRFARQGRLVDFEIVRLNDEPIGWQQIAVLYLANITDDDLLDRNLSDDVLSNDVELLVELDFRLQTAKLPFLGPIVECRHENDDDDSDDNGRTFDPFDIGLLCKTRRTRADD